MSNHVHLLIRESSESLASVIKRIAVSYAQYYNKKYIRFGHLFQDRFKSEPVNDNAYFFTLLQYIHQNPVAAGISVDVAGYRWSSWGEYERAGVGIRFVRELEQGKQTLRMDKVNDVLALFGDCLAPVKNDSV
jgi:hypothetical protein